MRQAYGMQRAASLLQRASNARPVGTAVLTGTVVMSVGDGASQVAVHGSSAVDVRRNAVSATYNGMASPVFLQWYRVMDWLIPGVGLRLIPKTLVSQLVTTGANNPLYFVWCNHIRALLDGGAVDWEAVRARTLEQCRRELPNLYGKSMLFWLPVTALNYAVVPNHLKVLWISSCSVLWGGFVSHVANR